MILMEVVCFNGGCVIFMEVVCTVQGLCNNAGIFNDKDWQKVQQINLDGMLTGTMLAFEKMGVRREERDSEREGEKICKIL